MSCILSALFINSRFMRVTLLLLIMPVFDSIATVEIEESQNKSTAKYDEWTNSVSDNGEKIPNISLENEALSTTTRLPFTFNEMATKPIIEHVEQKTMTYSSLDFNTDYQSMKRAFDIFNGKMDVYMAFNSNEMSFLTNRLNTLKDKLNLLETLHHEVDQIVSRQNMAEQKLQTIQDALLGSQSMNNKLDRLELLMLQTLFRIDDLAEKQRKLTPSSDEMRRKNVNDNEQLSSDNEQCESKIEQLVAFVYNFAELNRLENTDILNRLGNMQSQLIQFFDVKGTKTTNQIVEKSVNNTIEDAIEASESMVNLSNQLMVETMPIIPFNSTQIFSEESMPSISIATNDTKIDTPLSLPRRKRKRTINTRNRYKRNHKLNTTKLSQHRFDVSHFHYVNRFEHELLNDASHSKQSEIDVNISLIKNDNRTSAKYGQPSKFGCHQFYNRDHADEIHRFASANGSMSERLCSFDKNGSAWTVIQQRNHDSIPENFNRSWDEYKYGFGNLNGAFWYGNDFIHKLTYDDDMELKIHLEAWDGRYIDLQYDIFRVDSEENRYNLFINGFNGNDKHFDALLYHHNQDFSTYDRQNDKSGINDKIRCCSCAKSYASGWWFNNCIESNLNGIYQFNPLNNNYVGIIWEKWLGDYSLKATKMMIRPKVQWSNRNDDYDDETSKKPPDDP